MHYKQKNANFPQKFLAKVFFKSVPALRAQLMNKNRLQVVKKMRKKLTVVQLRRAARKPFKKAITVS
jgi:hypothetical protein